MPTSLSVISAVGLSPEVAKIVQQAQEDFDLLLSGHDPKNSKPESAQLDGGTTFFKQASYKITLMQKAAKVENVNGFLYGPILQFTDSRFQLSEPISAVKFYSTEELRKLLGGKL
jgi:hypothetical protein